MSLLPPTLIAAKDASNDEQCAQHHAHTDGEEIYQDEWDRKSLQEINFRGLFHETKFVLTFLISFSVGSSMVAVSSAQSNGNTLSRI